MIKFLLLAGLLLATACGSSSGGASPGANNVNQSVVVTENAKQLLERTYAIGASVTNNHAAESPGEKATRMAGTHDNFSRHAVDGIKGVDLLPSVVIPNGTTTVIGVDFLFWDSTALNCEPSVGALHQLITETKSKNINLVLGNIPPMMPQLQGCMDTLNTAIAQSCTAQNLCRLLDIKSLFVGLGQGGTVALNGHNYGLKDLMADSLHVNDIGSEVLADEILDLLK